MYERLYSFLTKHNFFYNLQFEFRRGHSTAHAATTLVEYICNAFEEKKYVFEIFLDLSIAFDTIDHNILFTKLQKYGIRGSAFDWFQSYLSNRSQLVECNGVLSSTQQILHGVRYLKGLYLGRYYF